MIKIIFMGTPQFSVPILEKLITASQKNNWRITAVITAPDKPVGRQQILTPPPIKKIARKYKIPVLQPEKAYLITDQIKKLNPDLIVVAAYGQILKKEILEVPKYGPVNVHASLLPKYRGASPIQYAILKGEKETGVTIMIMDEKMDQGPILTQKSISLSPHETARTLHDKLSLLGAKLLVETLSQWPNGSIKAKAQDHSRATYTKILTREDGKINWQQSAQEIERQIRAFDPWPGAYTEYYQKDRLKRLKILKAKIIPSPPSTSKAAKKQLVVPTGHGYLMLEQVQPEGKKPMSGQEFIRGHKDIILSLSGPFLSLSGVTR